MKLLPIIGSAAIAVTAAVVWLANRAAENPAPAPAPDPASLHKGAMARNQDHAEVFRRAFWRRPDATDKILHAERREWTPEKAEGISHWQWFIAAEPGPSLTKWLREENAFGVRPAKAPAISGSPSWFPGDTSDYEVRVGGAAGKLVFLFSRDGKKLFATGSGKGFTPAAAEPAKRMPAATASTNTGRLPKTPPPNPQQP